MLHSLAPPALHYSFFIGEKRMPTREDAWKLLCEYTASESLRKHMLAVEACVRAFARKAGAASGDGRESGKLAVVLDSKYGSYHSHPG
jgi:predicted hydrolase (HD superfamily)